MKKILGLFLLVLSFASEAQNQPYKWDAHVEYSNVVVLKLTCTIDSSWHVYDLASPNGLPPEISFPEANYRVLDVNEAPTGIKKYDEGFEDTVIYHEHQYEIKKVIIPIGTEPFDANIDVYSQACQEGGVCTRPETNSLTVHIDPALIVQESQTSNFWIFWAGFLGGLLALLTPCVFPMIPMTVTFFTKMSESRKKGIANALVYGLSIIVIYVALGLGVTLSVGANALNQMASSTVFNLIFFLVFVVFAASFLGAFEITLPSSFTNKIDAKSDKGGLIGIFFMAFTLALVSFSCTGPVIGTLLVEAAVGGGVLGPFLGMLGFSLALALPFTLFAIFPNWLNSLPKSGGWLNNVKVTLGLLELALAMKFISIVDLVNQWGIIKREVFVIVWMLIFLLLGLYMLGVIRFKHDSKMQKRGPIRILLALVSFAFVGYLTPGVIGGKLTSLSGILPPSFYSFGWGQGDNTNEQHCPNNLDCLHDYDEALIRAKKEGKPILVDFTGWSCANCRTVEQNVWVDSRVDSLIRNEYVLVSLYVDDRTDLPESEQIEVEVLGKMTKLVEYGDKWSAMEINRYGEATQPLYVLLDHEEVQLVAPESFTLDKDRYYQFLLNGLEKFRAKTAQKLP